MARKVDVKGGNGDVVFDTKTGTARKYLRNTSTAEKSYASNENLLYFRNYARIRFPMLLR